MIKNLTILFFVILFSISNIHSQEPNLAWARKIGGTGFDEAFRIATDHLGNVYIIGTFESVVDFDPGTKVYQMVSVGSSDIFVQKMDASGNLLWAKQMGGFSIDQGHSIAVDPMGNVYSTGYFAGTADFDPGTGVSELTSAGGNDIFVQKMDTDGNFLWAKQMGGSSNDVGYAIAVDTAGSVYTTGYFLGTADFNPGIGVRNLQSRGSDEIFIQKMDTDGNFLWAKQFGSTLVDIAFSIAVDASGNVYATGYFKGTVDFKLGVSAGRLTSAGEFDIFVLKLDTNGNFRWAKQMGGVENDLGNSIAVDAQGNVYTTGYFRETADFDPSTAVKNLSSNGSFDIFILKLDADGNFVWARQAGGSGNDIGFELAVDGFGNVYTTGYFRNFVDFDPGVNTNTLISTGINDIFIQKLDTDGDFVWAQQVGGTEFDIGNSITVDGSGNVYTTGYFQGKVDFDPGMDTIYLTDSGRRDVFVQKLSQGATTSVHTKNSVNESSTVFPNPTTGNLTIDLGSIQSDIKVKITDVNGRLIDSSIFAQQQMIDLSINESPGIYFITIFTATNHSVTRILKQ